MIFHLFLPGIDLISYPTAITFLPKTLALMFVHNVCAELMNLFNVLGFPKLAYGSVGVQFIDSGIQFGSYITPTSLTLYTICFISYSVRELN